MLKWLLKDEKLARPWSEVRKEDSLGKGNKTGKGLEAKESGYGSCALSRSVLLGSAEQSHCPRDLGGTMHMHYDKEPIHTFIVRLPLRQTIGSPLEKMTGTPTKMVCSKEPMRKPSKKEGKKAGTMVPSGPKFGSQYPCKSQA